MALFPRINIRHSFGVYLIIIFFSLVLFNTTYMGLGTIIPSFIILVIFIYALFNPCSQNRTFVPFIIYALLIIMPTLFMGGEVRVLAKIILLIFLTYIISLLNFSLRDIKFISLMICVTYCIYAIMVIKSIGLEWRDYGRVQINILNSDIPLDPNVISSTFILPSIIALYNLMYGRTKVLAAVFISLFMAALICTGSRGAFISLVVTSLILIFYYIINNKRKQTLFIKLCVISLMIFAIYCVIFYISQQSNLTGLSRLVDYSDGTNGRTMIWQEKFSLLLDSPLLGYGVNRNVGILTRGEACHNTFLEIMFYGGIIGFTFFMIPFITLFRRKTLPFYVKIVLFLSVCLPLCSIDSLQERTLWNFLIFFEILSRFKNAEEGLLWTE